MQVINIPTMKGMIEHIGIKKRRPLAFWGASGIGKSEGIAECAAEHGAVLVDVRLSQYESVDLRGIPDIQTGSTVWNAPATIPFKGNTRFDEDGPLIFLFLDEINSAEPSTAAVAYQLVNDRRVGEHVLMDNVVIIAAGNREIDRGVVNRFPAPLANRFTHAELIPDVKSWSAWAAKAGVPSTLIGFLNFRSELLHTFDPAKPQKVFATPRTWSFVAADMADDTIPADVKGASISGSVGEGPGVELMGFIKIMDSIRPIEEIIADPEGVPVSDELDLQWAMATHVAGNMAKDNADSLHKFLSRLEPEMVVMAWTLAINRDETITDSNAFLYGYAPQYRGLFQN
jgi:hypothetical protein